jgi:hypothetical protein
MSVRCYLIGTQNPPLRYASVGIKGRVRNERLWWASPIVFRPTYAGANVGHPWRSMRPARGLRARPAVSHISRKRARCPEFPVRSSGQDSVCAFLKGKAHEVQGTHETAQEIGDVGHPAVVAGIGPKGRLLHT